MTKNITNISKKHLIGIILLIGAFVFFFLYFYSDIKKYISLVPPSSNLASVIHTVPTCNQADVQTAIDTAQEGDTVIIPNGRCTWDNGITLNKQIKLRGETKGGVQLLMGANIVEWHHGMIIIYTGGVEISNLEFWPGSGSGTYIVVFGDNDSSPPLIYDNLFSSQGELHNFIYWGRFGGVIYNNVFQSTYNEGLFVLGDGIQIKGQGEVSWATSSTMGTDDINGKTNLYIESNIFHKTTAIDPSGGARVVFRNNIVDNSSLASHGADTEHWGMRHVEIYDNQFYFNQGGTWTLYDIDRNPITGDYPLNLQAWWGMRGGTGVVTGNSMPDIYSNHWNNKAEILLEIHNADRYTTIDPCISTYPAYHQVGRGMNNSLEPAYIWGNTGASQYIVGMVGSGMFESDPWTGPRTSGYNQCQDVNPNWNNPGFYIQQDRDFYLGVSKPGWTRYTYPHPLTIGITTSSYTLTLNKIGQGTVTSSPSGINCDSTCSAQFDSGTTVTLTATPASGSTFTGWSGGGCSGTGNCTVSSAASVTATFTTVADTTAPSITSITATNVSSGGATITWTTNESATSRVEYGLTTSYGSQTTLSSSLVTSHSVALSGLSAGTTYHYRVISTDGAGNTTTSSDQTFTTSAVSSGGSSSGGSSSGSSSSGSGSSRSSRGGSSSKTTATTTTVATALAGCLPGYLFNIHTGKPCTAPVVTPQAGCLPGYLFNIFTGNPCATTLPPGCLPGYLFSIETGKPCSSSPLPLTVVTTTTAVPSVSAPVPVFTSSPVPTPPPSPTLFTRDLTLGSVGEDVRALQVFLNSQGYVVALVGPGSRGNETDVFGVSTLEALARFQVAKRIFPATGYFGPLTRSFVVN